MGVTISDNLFRIHPKQQPTVQGFCHVGHCSKTSKTSLEQSTDTKFINFISTFLLHFKYFVRTHFPKHSSFVGHGQTAFLSQSLHFKFATLSLWPPAYTYTFSLSNFPIFRTSPLAGRPGRQDFQGLRDLRELRDFRIRMFSRRSRRS